MKMVRGGGIVDVLSSSNELYLIRIVTSSTLPSI